MVRMRSVVNFYDSKCIEDLSNLSAGPFSLSNNDFFKVDIQARKNPDKNGIYNRQDREM